MTEPEMVDYDDPGANMYGVRPCPECGSTFRYSVDSVIRCDDCGYRASVKVAPGAEDAEGRA